MSPLFDLCLLCFVSNTPHNISTIIYCDVSFVHRVIVHFVTDLWSDKSSTSLLHAGKHTMQHVWTCHVKNLRKPFWGLGNQELKTIRTLSLHNQESMIFICPSQLFITVPLFEYKKIVFYEIDVSLQNA